MINFQPSLVVRSKTFVWILNLFFVEGNDTQASKEKEAIWKKWNHFRWNNIQDDDRLMFHCVRKCFSWKGMRRMSWWQWYFFSQEQSGSDGFSRLIVYGGKRKEVEAFVSVLVSLRINICFVLTWDEVLTVAVKFRFFISLVSGCCTIIVPSRREKRNFLCSRILAKSAVNARDATWTGKS